MIEHMKDGEVDTKSAEYRSGQAFGWFEACTRILNEASRILLETHAGQAELEKHMICDRIQMSIGLINGALIALGAQVVGMKEMDRPTEEPSDG